MGNSPYDINPYVDLMQRFLRGDLTAGDFENLYLTSYLADPTRWPSDIFDILDEVFAAVDAFNPDPQVETLDGIDEAQLRDTVRSALSRLPHDETLRGTLG